MVVCWRQGDVLSPDHATQLGAIAEDAHDTHRALVLSHSCDIARTEDIEPKVELLIAKIIEESAATLRNGHGIRKLHVHTEPSDGGNNEWLELEIDRKFTTDKGEFFNFGGRPISQLPADQRGVFRRWLAQRYSRSDFPNAFNTWLRDSGIDGKFDKLGKRYSHSLVAVYFDFSDDTERDNPEDPYELGIQLVYQTSDTSYREHAAAAAQELNQLFITHCLANGEWKWFELLYCEEIADNAFTLKAANTFRRWRFEHRSIDGQPVDGSE